MNTSKYLPKLVLFLLILGCSSSKTGKVSSPYYAQKDWSDATIKVVPLQDSVTVHAHGVPVYVFEYLEYDVAVEKAEQVLEKKFYEYFAQSLRGQTKLELLDFEESFQIAPLAQREFSYGQNDTLRLHLPNGSTVASFNGSGNADFLLFLEGLTFDVREQYFSGRNRKAYLRVHFDYAIWDNRTYQVANFGKINISEPASFGVANGTFKSSFSERTWAKTISKAAELVINDTPFAK